MFLFERLFGITVYICALVFIIALLYVYKVNVNKVLKTYIVILSVMAFFYVPYTTADLYRINEEMLFFAQHNVIDFTGTFLLHSTTPVADLLYYIVGCTGILRLLPVISTVITYSCIFYVTGKAAEMYEIKSKDVAVAVFFLMSVGSYMYVISNIRTMIAMSILCFCVFRESFEGKKFVSNIPLYLAAVLTHNLAAIVFAFRVILLIHSKNVLQILREKISNVNRKAPLIIAGAAACIVLGFLGWFSWDIIQKAFGYIFGETYSYIWEYIIAAIALVTELYILHHARKKHASDIIGDKTPERLMIICIAAACAFCFVFTIFYRILIFIIPTLIVPYMMIVLGQKPAGRRGAYKVDRFRKVIIWAS